MGWKSLNTSLLRAPLCGANNKMKPLFYLGPSCFQPANSSKGKFAGILEGAAASFEKKENLCRGKLKTNVVFRLMQNTSEIHIEIFDHFSHVKI